MGVYTLDGEGYRKLIIGAYNKIASDEARINALNVFPVPDGDTGSNMRMTLEGGEKKAQEELENNIGLLAKSIARAMVLTARGNSGVILSQFFKGLSTGLENYSIVNTIEFADAMCQGTKKAYSVVTNPVEGTILTVMRMAGDAAIKQITKKNSLEEYLEIYLIEANIALQKTPDLLPVLKKAGVIDSGGAGFILVVEGMLEALNGKTYDSKSKTTTPTACLSTASFDADSELTYGYCTEFILQLQNKKVDVKSFNLDIITNFLNNIGNSIVAFKDEDIIKVHVHTMDPGLVLSEFRKYGEYLTIKIENMNVQHTEGSAFENTIEEKEFKKYATVVVVTGEGLVSSFKDLGVDEVVEGGQTMNTSTEDFINTFKKINSEYILVYPNNSNIKLAANLAAESYTDAKVIVIPTKTIAEGYSAISMLNTEYEDVDDIISEQQETISGMNTLEVTYSVRDTVINDIDIKKGDYICLFNHDLIACNKNRLESIKKAFEKISLDDKAVVTIFYGKDTNEKEVSEITDFVSSKNSSIECYSLNGKQDIYSYIIGIE